MSMVLIENIDRVHTTDLGIGRIRKNLGLREIKNVYSEGELIRESTVANFATVQNDSN